MIARQDDEEIPLLQRPEQPTAKTPLPWDQFWIILFVQLSELLVSETLAPFTPQLIRDIGVTHGDESQVGYFVGILRASYHVSQTLTIFFWSQLSDRIGRKPLILTALFTIVVTMLSFGLSRTFLGLLVSRVICGAFNGTGGVVKGVVMDITDATNLPNAYGYMPLSWISAAAIGPLVGGSLSRPADRFPEIFGRSELLKTYPYLLPCAFPAICAFYGLAIHVFPVSTTTPLWELIEERFLRQSYAKPSKPSSNALASPGGANSEEVSSEPVPLRALLTPKVLIVTASYGTMELFYMSLYSILPLFYATPIELGGLSLDPPRIGTIFAISGFIHGTSQLLFYARLHDRFGAYAIHMAGLGSGIPIVILFPVINALARAHGMGLAVWMLIGLQLALIFILEMCYPCMASFIRAAAPNRTLLGATNGIVLLVAGGALIIGPTCSAVVFSYSMQEGRDAWLVYYLFMAMAFLALGTSLFLPRDPSLWEEVP
ncbi:major facilitator superfamily domain-containing protein [Suillus ampliporus]|nr:major facilitator superfamily domain-containing protein [Suillus ampliporus]